LNLAALRRGRTIASALPPVLLVVATLCRLWPSIESTPFHRDEARWIGNAAILREWRHPFGDRWQDDGYRNVYGTLDESNRRRSQPPLGMYVFGLGLLAQGEGVPRIGYWIMEHDTAWNEQRGNMPSQAQIRAARRTNVFVALLTVLAIYLIGSGTINHMAGTVAGLAYGFHPLVRDTATRALSDPLLVLCVVSAALAALHLGKRPSMGRALLVGTLLGLGASTKLSPLLLAAAIGSLAPAFLAWTWIARHRRGYRWALCSLTIPISAIATFLASYPYLWTDPIGHTRRMFAFRELSFDLQAVISPHARVHGIPDAFRRFGVQLGHRESIGGVLLDWLGRSDATGAWTWLREADLMLAPAGWLLLVPVIVSARYPGRIVFPMAIVGGQFMLIALTFRLDYARYMLPVLPAIAIGIGAVFGLAWQRLWQAVGALAGLTPAVADPTVAGMERAEA
jgi:4-amino-4-deoxy-L-arabinose transferase-like glycosyltransferase